MEVAHLLEVKLDDTKRILLSAADGGSFIAFPSHTSVEYVLEKKGYQPIKFEGTIYFAEEGEVSLLGHYQCLDKFDVTFHGPEKTFSLLPRFKK